MDESKQQLKADEVGEALHTALRKCCDSTESSYAWNVIHLLDETWAAFCTQVAERGVEDGEGLKAVFDDRRSWEPAPDSRTRESFYARKIFSIALEEMDVVEWEGFAAYLHD